MPKKPLTPMLLRADSDSTPRIYPAASWAPTDDADSFRESLETRNMPASNVMSIGLGIEVCNTVDAPDNPGTALATARTSDGLTFPGAFVDKSATTGNRQFWRPIYIVKNTGTGDTTVRFAWAAGMIETRKN